MRLGNLFTVRLPIDQTWQALLDIERIAPCVPGARLIEVVDGEYHGAVKVQVGAAAAEYDGWLRITDVDEGARRIAIHATGTETRDGSQAAAWVTATLTSAGGATSVAVDTELSVGGKLSRFGAGVMTDVSAVVLKRFARRLEAAPAAMVVPASPPSPPSPGVTAPAPLPPSAGRSGQPWARAGLIGVLAAMAVAPRRRWRWALALVGAALVAVGQRKSSST